MELESQIAELLTTIRIGGGVLLAVGAATAGCNLVMLLRLRRLEERQARLEAWQEQHRPALERLAIEQEDPARAASLRRPHRGGSREAPL